MKKHLLVAGAVTTVGLAGLAGATVANAETNGSTSTNPMSSLVDAISSKFNLNKTDVQKVFDEQRTKMDATREQQVKDQVAQLVKDGKLTQAQADKINAKRAELDKQRQADMTANQNLTEAQRQAKRDEMRTQMDAKKTELDTWLKDNGIDTQYAYLLMGGRGGHGGPGGMHRGDRDGDGDGAKNTSSTTTTSSSQ